MMESYSEDKGKNIALGRLIQRSNLEPVDTHLDDQQNIFIWKSRVLEDFSDILKKDSTNRVKDVYDLILNMASTHIKTYNEQIENQEKDLQEVDQKVIKDVLTSSLNALRKQRTFYTNICERLYNLSEEDTYSQKVLLEVIGKMQKELVDQHQADRENDTIASQIDNERVVDPTEVKKYLHLN